MIRGYPARASVLPGEVLVLHIATDAPRFRVCFYRWWDGAELLCRSRWFDGVDAAPRGADEDWGWPGYAFSIPGQWRSAVYIAHLEEVGGPAFDLALDRATVLFVVRGGGSGGLLYKIPLATYHAYNHMGGGCYYDCPPVSLSPPGARVSLRRPGGGIGGEVWGAADHYDMRSPRQTFAHWDAGFIRWLIRDGYAPEFCTDIDVHRDAGLCRRYRLLLSVGHDEYWSEAMRDHVEEFVGAGGNVAFFAANLCWWRIHLVDDAGAMVCHQGGPQGARDHWWPAGGAGRTEDALGGVSYRHGGGWWNGPRSKRGFTVQRGDHWAFEGTGLRDGDVFGAGTLPPLVGYECDGAPVALSAAFPGAVAVSPHARLAGTPEGFDVLAACVLDADWEELAPREEVFASECVRAATMGVYSRQGTVFTAGTTDWAQVLAGGQDCHVERITRNVLSRLLQ